ncbi:D-glycero-beta-D-manno-heptose 1-phosphate adenylyltransferase [Polynucleobacter sp. HIN9]|uniref:D-glycero-beta-D-manno-heptose 1-phosphate adenylyltransferase n=1 Tax=unclassified Polynucleobacter TaxID=2640945 RepID=UPI002572B7D7|nr:MULTISPECIES: D-glycero-beta-D-manno-heptose 1-phosphate adenylyltransferase [unclassified Polynucleobacter]BEI41766.1 D-glycero-beta-D-manno-heptose 1-phosphate adenylyltransferase [Polynucleobacter sp. HIN9]
MTEPILKPPAFEAKLCATSGDLEQKLKSLARPMVFTNGVFDLLHRGHVSYLAQARQLGGSLVVGVNSDASVRMLGKGSDRPINGQEDRMALLAALESVDLVVLFSEQTPVELIRKIRPDIYVKGGDYAIETLEETKVVNAWGGKAYAIPFIHERSTTNLLGKIRS